MASHRSGHDISTCFSKNGFPDWWGDRPRGFGRGAGLKPARIGRSIDEEEEGDELACDGEAVQPPSDSPASQRATSPVLVPAECLDEAGVGSRSAALVEDGSNEPRIGDEDNLKVDVEEMGHGKRVEYSFVKLEDFVTNTMQKLSSPLPSSSLKASAAGHRSFLAVLTAGTKPRSFKEVMKFPQWREAMKKQIEALEDNKT
ncbi:hypothetical protein LIER_31432 [Lithospermum erythrorhizon]|uniref:Uncharacterized protein n=1 Tax=Lithospermum erythrorhizon TaxID=34254 RepID=A0AAV3RT23_LITER